MFIMLCLMCMVLGTMSHPNITTIFPPLPSCSNGTAIGAGAWFGVFESGTNWCSVNAIRDRDPIDSYKVLGRSFYSPSQSPLHENVI